MLQVVATADTSTYTDVPWAAPSTAAATSPLTHHYHVFDLDIMLNSDHFGFSSGNRMKTLFWMIFFLEQGGTFCIVVKFTWSISIGIDA